MTGGGAGRYTISDVAIEKAADNVLNARGRRDIMRRGLVVTRTIRVVNMGSGGDVSVRWPRMAR